ncbi:MAG TPA: TolC family protein [Gemmataceae bacterium]|nr:TolC family protein [Gemmataceae bacterium]
MDRNRMWRVSMAALPCCALISALAVAQPPAIGPVIKVPVPAIQKEISVGPPSAAAQLTPIFKGGSLLPIDLPTALQLANASNPIVAMARVRVEQAYQRQVQADVLWLPSLVGGTTYLRHDGLTQNQAGTMLFSNRWSFGVGGGAVLRGDSSDALFAPLIARRLTDAQAAQAQAVANNIGLDAAFAYFDLLDAHARLVIQAASLADAEEMLRVAEVAEKAGAGKTPADAPRAQTEVRLRRAERQRLEAHAADVSARLVQLLVLDPTVDLVPADAAVLQLTLMPVNGRLEELIDLGLQNRPEVREGRFLADAAQTRYRQAQWDPLLPKFEMGYTGNHFVGGIHDEAQQAAGRGDGVASIYWELRNLGAGNIAKVRERRAFLDESTYNVLEIQARVGAEITSAAKNVLAWERSLNESREAVVSAEETWRRLKASQFGMTGRDRRYDPLEPLIALQQLDAARLRYLENIIGYNKSQFRLFQALGNPLLGAAVPGNPR